MTTPSPEERARKLARGLDLRNRMMQGMQTLGPQYFEHELQRSVDLIADVIRAEREATVRECAKEAQLWVEERSANSHLAIDAAIMSLAREGGT